MTSSPPHDVTPGQRRVDPQHPDPQPPDSSPVEWQHRDPRREHSSTGPLPDSPSVGLLREFGTDRSVPGRLLIVTAVVAEADAVRAGLDPGTFPATVHVEPVGVGPAAAAAGTARLLALAEAKGNPYRAVLSAGIAGGFAARADVGGTVLGARSVAADLGAESPSGFLPVEQLGFGTSVLDADPALLKALTSALPHAVVGDVLTLATVTGTAETAAVLLARHPDAVAEAMEGYGVACAARTAGVPFAELRAISNPVGPRDRAAWRLREAFSALTEAAAAACG